MAEKTIKQPLNLIDSVIKYYLLGDLVLEIFIFNTKILTCTSIMKKLIEIHTYNELNGTHTTYS